MYYPFVGSDGRLAMTMSALDPEAWIEIDERFSAELAEKRALLRDRHDEVFAALPGSEPGQREVLKLLAAFLPRRFPERYSLDGRTLTVIPTGERWNLDGTELAPLDLAGRLVQEDLCLMRPGPAGYLLGAASLCFPSRWSLAEKIGKPLGGIHERVPTFEERLARPVGRLFETLKAERPVSRLNWTLTDSPDLFLPHGKGRTDLDPAIIPTNAGDRVWLRIERQTLRRLPLSGDVLFTIRTYVEPVREVAQHPDLAVELCRAVELLSPEMQAYKSLTPFRAALVQYLRECGRRVPAGAA